MSDTPQRSAGSITPMLLCASRQPIEMSGQYIDRSTMIPRSAATIVETAVLSRRGSTVSTLTVDRPLAGTSIDCGIVSPLGSRYVSVACAVIVDGLLNRMKHSKNGPVAPSARNQCRLVLLTPAAS